jgi:hypothetical protein
LAHHQQRAGAQILLVRIDTVALDFLPTDASFEKLGITNITLPAPLVASDGWAVGAWFRLRSALADTPDRNGVNQLLQLATSPNSTWDTPNNINLWWATNNNLVTIDGVESVSGKFYAAPSSWVAGNNSNPGNWSDVAFASDDTDRLLILQLVNVAGSWRLRLYVTAKGSSATLVNESPVVTPIAILVDHIRIGNRIPAQANRDWRDAAGQLFLLKRPLSIAEITQLAVGTSVISNVAVAADILGHWPLEAAGAAQIDASGRSNDLSQFGTPATYAGFNFISAATTSTSLTTASSRHTHVSQAAAFSIANNVAPAQARHLHTAQSIVLASPANLLPTAAAHALITQNPSLGSVATSIARPFPHGDVDLTLSSVSAASSAAPVVTLWGDPEGNQNIPNSWHNLCARLDGVLNKTPQITIANVHQWRNGQSAGLGLPQRGWRPWWRVTGGVSTSWQRFDAYSVSGNSISFANVAAFTTSSIEVAFFPVWNLDETNALFDHIYASGSGSEPPAAIAYRSTRPALPLGTHNQTAAVISPDGIAVPILSMRSARISSLALLSPEGLPKRRAVIFFNMHAQEASGGWSADRFLRTLVSSSADAIWLRDRFMFDCYSVNNSGLAGGASRGVVEGWDGVSDLIDPNRSWPAQISPPNGPSPEVNDVVSSIVVNTSGKTDVLISFHSDALTSVDYGLAYYFAGWDALVAVKAFKDALLAAPPAATLLPVSDNMAQSSPGLYLDQGFGRHILGAALSWVQETTFATSDYLADSQTLATRHIVALRQLTQGGLLPVEAQTASSRHGQQAQIALLATAGAVAAQPSSHVHKSTAVVLATAGQVSPFSVVHNQQAQIISLATASNVAASSTRHTHISVPTAFSVAGQISSLAASHKQNTTQANLIVPNRGNPLRGRIRPAKSERRILKLRFS